MRFFQPVHIPKIQQHRASSDRLNVSYFTDPLCPWSWAMERGWAQLLDKWESSIDVIYKLTGLVVNRNDYRDEPPLSIPACLAVKCIQRQFTHFVSPYLQLLVPIL
jgi:predicted DsbA family dithiol-disulfide isomerase